MNEPALQELARQISQQLLHETWPYTLFLIILSATIGALSNWATGYFRKRGETRAIKADLEELLRQSSAITSKAEEVKTSIFQAAWASRENRTIRRAKLEDLTLAVHELQGWFSKRRNFVVHGTPEEPGPPSINKVVVLANLYFPELLLESKRLLNIHLRYDALQLETSNEKRMAGDNVLAQTEVVAASSKRSGELFGEYLLAAEEISVISRSLMKKILDV